MKIPEKVMSLVMALPLTILMGLPASAQTQQSNPNPPRATTQSKQRINKQQQNNHSRAKGAATGAAIGAATGNAGRGAAVGAVVGGTGDRQARRQDRQTGRENRRTNR